MTVEPHALGGLRQIRVLNFSSNDLQTLEEGSFHSVNSLETLRVDGNPLMCDCRLLWILQRRKTLNFDGRVPVCAGPVEVQGVSINSFTDSALFDHFTCQKPKIRNRKLQQVMETMTVRFNKKWIDVNGVITGDMIIDFTSIKTFCNATRFCCCIFWLPVRAFLSPHLLQVIAREGQSVSFLCRAEGEPAPVIVWISPQRRRITAKSSGRITVLPSGTLEIRYAQLTDSGTYICIASNAGGNDTYFATLTVRGQPLDSASAFFLNRSLYSSEFFNDTNLNSTRVFLKFTLDLTTILVSTAMGCITFLGVVLFCFLLLFVWSRGRGQRKNNFTVEYSFRKSEPTTGGSSGGTRKFNMKMIWNNAARGPSGEAWARPKNVFDTRKHTQPLTRKVWKHNVSSFLCLQNWAPTAKLGPWLDLICEWKNSDPDLSVLLFSLWWKSWLNDKARNYSNNWYERATCYPCLIQKF